jgi:hypothetical protein
MNSAEAETPQLASVVTGMRVFAPPENAWDALMFYEEVPRCPPFYMRLLLPAPLRVEGPKSAVDDESRCVYREGYLVKRVTRVDRGRRYSFRVVEQKLAIGGGMVRLVGGSFVVRGLPDGQARVELETCFHSSRRPGWLWRPIEAAVCHAFHRHLLRAIRAEVTRRAAPPAAHEATSGRP